VWLVMLAPVSASSGQDNPWSYGDCLAGFVVVYDRDENDAYELAGKSGLNPDAVSHVTTE
jgi:hypothetical protein